ncbi:hypothetical protein HYFRA_00001157 [Hymenoscyphus fraxineus]|uniref:Uncharacterized protein n=1 Tax=Hymenoscyphus fraxineus TaxID=746836 RepID=A0A9N9KUJ8_9HELO|nr:hypothetical protein HYFRA_00001157 [Hymenoscyphus fraxineus]
MQTPLHPFYPPGIELSGGEFVANRFGALALVLAFGAGCFVILGSALIVANWANPRLSRADRALFLWRNDPSTL